MNPRPQSIGMLEITLKVINFTNNRGSERQMAAVNISESFVKEHIEKWVNAWNGHDLKTVLSMYSDDIEFSSPKIKVLFPEHKMSKVTNKRELEQYWTKALKNYPNLLFIPKQTISQGNICVFEYFAILDGKIKTSVIEKFEFQDDGLVRKSSGFYGAEEPI